MENRQRSKDGQPLPPLQHVLGITSGVRDFASTGDKDSRFGCAHGCWLEGYRICWNQEGVKTLQVRGVAAWWPSALLARLHLCLVVVGIAGHAPPAQTHARLPPRCPHLSMGFPTMAQHHLSRSSPNGHWIYEVRVINEISHDSRTKERVRQ